jgi:hypothetical protein
MRLAKGIAAAACFLVGLWLMLRAAGLLTAVVHAGPRWWPALPAATGAAILIRSPGPGPHRRVAIALIGASGVAFAIVHHEIARTVWPFAASAGLMAAGLALAYLATRASPASGTTRSQRVVVAFRSAAPPAVSADVARIRAYVFCGRLELDIRACLPPGSFPEEPLMIEIVACLGNVAVVAYPGVAIHPHEAFVMGLGRPAHGAVLGGAETSSAAAVVATIEFFGSVTVRQRNPTAVSPGNQLEGSPPR